MAWVLAPATKVNLTTPSDILFDFPCDVASNGTHITIVDQGADRVKIYEKYPVYVTETDTTTETESSTETETETDTITDSGTITEIITDTLTQNYTDTQIITQNNKHLCNFIPNTLPELIIFVQNGAWIL